MLFHKGNRDVRAQAAATQNDLRADFVRARQKEDRPGSAAHRFALIAPRLFAQPDEGGTTTMM
jgi:hypothetical protein